MTWISHGWMTMKDLDVLIIGAGIGGLTAALALQKVGCHVAVYEKARELGEVGAGVTITPNAGHVLDHLLGREIMQRIGYVPASGAMKHFRTGAVLVDTRRGDGPRRKYGADYSQMHRADLHSALADAVRRSDAQAIHADRCFVGISETPERVTARFRDGHTAEAQILIGADGIRSDVRKALWGEEQVAFTGYIAWRGLVPTERLDPAVVIPDSASFVGRGKTFARYKVRQGTLLNYVAFSKRDTWAEESWSVHAELAEVQAEFREFCPEVQQILAATPPENCFRWGLFDRQPLAAWTRGRATLLGDAAHPMTPFLAQGAAMAIEDAMILTRSVAAADNWSEALSRYEAARRERGTFVMLESHANARRMYTRDPDNYTASSHRHEDALGLYAYNPLTVPV
jgi:salicylate hydroxylase